MNGRMPRHLGHSRRRRYTGPGFVGGAIAQLGERLPRTEEVGGSNPLRSTIHPNPDLAAVGTAAPWSRPAEPTCVASSDSKTDASQRPPLSNCWFDECSAVQTVSGR